MTRDEHNQQRHLVDASLHLSERRQERRDEAAAYARLYEFPRRNVTAAPQRPPEPPRSAA